MTGLPKTLIEPALTRVQPEDRAEQRRLAGAVGAEHADELAFADGQADILQDSPAADRKRNLVKEYRGIAQDVLWSSALAVASSVSSIHSANVLPAGSVSVTGTSGTPDDFASAARFRVKASSTWEL